MLLLSVTRNQGGGWTWGAGLRGQAGVQSPKQPLLHMATALCHYFGLSLHATLLV